MPLHNTSRLSVERPFYFPLNKGQYEVRPGLFSFPHDFGNGVVDQQVFQFDSLFECYAAEKQAARREHLDKYYVTRSRSAETLKAINRFIITTLCQEHPGLFKTTQLGPSLQLECHLSKETIAFDENYELLKVSGTANQPPYRDMFDALASQLQEDLAIVQIDNSDRDYISDLHLCFANHWAAEDKIGQSFIAAHSPVPGMDDINRHSTKLMQSIINKGPFVRFAWGIATDTRLNHHPSPPTGISQADWQGRCFDPERAELYLRVERQTLHGFADTQSALFTIRSYFYDIKKLKQQTEYKDKLISAITSMDEDALNYKGLLASKQAMLEWLATG